MSSQAENLNSKRNVLLWRSNNTCVICQDLCPTAEDKKKHEEQSRHKKKLLVYDFFIKEIPKSKTFMGPSVLLKRYTACGENAIGLECLQEMHFSFSSAPLWACSICYESGALMEHADLHLFSMTHIATYLDEFHSLEFAKISKVRNSPKAFDGIKNLCDRVFKEQGHKNLSPECLIMDPNILKNEAMTRLAIQVVDLKSSFDIHTDNHCCEPARKILQCSICYQLVACNDEWLKRIWSTHELSPGHRQAVAVSAFFRHCKLEHVTIPATIVLKNSLRWTKERDCNYGPVCGMKFLVAFNKCYFCLLCYTLVKSIEKHFSSEYHIMRFLSLSYPVDVFRASQCAQETRLNKIMQLMSTANLNFGNDKSYRISIDWFPDCLKTILNVETHMFPTLMPTLSPFGFDSYCLFCPVCLLTLKVTEDVIDGGEAIWNSHCEENSHFDYAIRRACFCFVEKFFVPVSSKLQKVPRVLHGQWIETKESKDRYVQTQRDVGLEFVVDDQENQEVVCTLCARWFAREMETLINNHIRSYTHLNHYLHVSNRSLLAMVSMQKSAEASRELMLEWLKRSSYNEQDEMRLYSPQHALQMLQWGSVAIRKVDVVSHDLEHRPVFECVMAMVDEVALDNVECETVSIKEALALSGVKILLIKQRGNDIDMVLCRCTQCGMAFSSTVDIIATNVWDRHFSSQQHFARLEGFLCNKLEMLGFSESISSYTVKPFKQDENSLTKVVWKWNAIKRNYEFMLSVIGLDEMVERRSNEITGVHPPDFFCRLCAIVIPCRSSALESHIRSLQHVLFYVHKYKPEIIMEIDLSRNKEREIRRMLAELLKDSQTENLFCIPIYDPIGEQKRKCIAAMQTAKKEEHDPLIMEYRKETQEERNNKDGVPRKRIDIQQESARLVGRTSEESERGHVQHHVGRKVEKKRLCRQSDSAAGNEEAKKKYGKEMDGAVCSRKQDKLFGPSDLDKKCSKGLQVKETVQCPLMAEKNVPERKMHGLEKRHQGGATNAKTTTASTLGFRYDSSGAGKLPSFPLNTANESYQYSKSFSSEMYKHPVPPPPIPFDISFNANIANKKVGAQVSSKNLEESENATLRSSLRGRKVDPYISNDKIIQSRNQLVDFIWRQGAERIPANELPTKFNNKAAQIEGAIGIDTLYEVVCIDCSDLDTFYCSMCGVWTTPNEMLKHLATNNHKLAYMFRNYKMYHQAIISESNILARTAMIDQFSKQIWKMEKPPGKITNRLRSLLDRLTIERIWPEYVNVLDVSWKDDGEPINHVEVPPPISMKALGLVDESSKVVQKNKIKDIEQCKKIISEKNMRKHSSITEKKESSNRKKQESSHSRNRQPKSETCLLVEEDNHRKVPVERKRHRSRSNEKRSSSYKRSRARSKSHQRRDSKCDPSYNRSRRRDRSASRDTGSSSSRCRRRSRSRSYLGNVIKDSGMSWEATTAAFLAKLGNPKAAAFVSQPSNRVYPVDEKTQQLKNLVESNSTVQSFSKMSGSLEYQKTSSQWQPISAITNADEKAKMRKLLGVLITMQQEAEKHGRIDKYLVDKLYKEVGLKKSVDSSDELLAQLCLEISQDNETINKPVIDLKSFGINTRSESPQLTTGYSYVSTSSRPQVDDFVLRSVSSVDQTLLDEVKRSLCNIKASRQPLPLVKPPPLVITNRDDMFPGTETIPCVYPGSSSHMVDESARKEKHNKNVTLPSFAVAQSSKKEKATWRRKQLLEEAERLRKQAEEENTSLDDDDWDCLAEVINGPLPSKSSKNPSEALGNKHDNKSNLKKPIAPGQKIPLARTILPNGEPLPEATDMWQRDTKKSEANVSIVEDADSNVTPAQGTPFSWPQPLPQPFLGSHMVQYPQLPQYSQQQHYPDQAGMDQQQHHLMFSNYGIPYMHQEHF